MTGRRGFTLVELLIVMLIIAVLVLLAWGALAGVAEQAKATRTRSIVMKLDQFVMQRYDGYRTRPLPMPRPVGFSPQQAATMRLAAIRDLMRLELPDRKSDVIDPPADIDPRAGFRAYLGSGSNYGVPVALQRVYQRKALAATGGNLANWSETSQGAECLYLIVSTMHDGDKNALDFFMPGEIGDVDEDGMREILDGWGQPIEFLRWAPGFRNDPGGDLQWGVAGVDDDGNGTIDDYSELGLDSSDVVRLTMQRPDLPDRFDPLRLQTGGFDLHPLIFSGGPDKSLDMITDNTAPTPFHRYCPPATDNNWPQPFSPLAISAMIGTAADTDGDGAEWADNITNHWKPTND